MFEKETKIFKIDDPTDIIYENYSVSKMEQSLLLFMKCIIVFYWISFFLQNSYVIYMLVKNSHIIFKTNEQCENIIAEY